MALIYKMRAIAVSDSSYVFWTDSKSDVDGSNAPESVVVDSIVVDSVGGTASGGSSGPVDLFESDSNDIAWWKCDDAFGASTIVNYGTEGTGANFTTLHNVYTGVQGNPRLNGKALYVPGNTTYASTANGVVQPAGSVTVSLLTLYLNRIGTYRAVLTKCSTNGSVPPFWSITIGRENSPSGGPMTGYYDTKITYQNYDDNIDFSWQHRVLTYDATTGDLKMYLNGILHDTDSGTPGGVSWASDGRAGAWIIGDPNFTAYAAPMLIQDIRVATVVRSQTWVEDYYAHTFG